jgi:hypothetical protein
MQINFSQKLPMIRRDLWLQYSKATLGHVNKLIPNITNAHKSKRESLRDSLTIA